MTTTKRECFALAVIACLASHASSATELGHDPDLQAIDTKWQKRFDRLISGERLEMREVRAATRAALQPKATKATIYRAILIRDAGDMLFDSEDLSEAEQIKRSWMALKVRPSYESKKARLLCENDNWDIGSLTPLSLQLFEDDESDSQVAIRAGLQLLDYYPPTKKDKVEVVKLISARFEKLCQPSQTRSKCRFALALSYIMLSNKQKSDRKEFLLKAKSQYLLSLKDPLISAEHERWARYQLAQIEIAFSIMANGIKS